jgi:hypothetical protein
MLNLRCVTHVFASACEDGWLMRNCQGINIKACSKHGASGGTPAAACAMTTRDTVVDDYAVSRYGKLDSGRAITHSLIKMS